MIQWEPEMGKISVIMNKPVYLRQAILNLSKIIMYEFHYDHMLPKYGDNIQLCSMDRDSLVQDITTDNFYEDTTGNIEARFNTSGHNPSWVHPLPMGVNRKVIGLMKDELGGRIMTKFVALRPSCKHTNSLGGSGGKNCTGVKKCVVKKTLDFHDYKQCLFEGRNAFRNQLLFQNGLHKVHTVEVNKLALSRNDDKRVIQSDDVSTLAHGHKDAPKNIALCLGAVSRA